MTAELTQERLKELLHYAPETGFFTRIGGKFTPGKCRRAGCLIKEPNGYRHRKITVLGCHYREPRLAFLYMEGFLPEGEICHLDGDTTNNAWRNLEMADRKKIAAVTRHKAPDLSPVPALPESELVMDHRRLEVVVGGNPVPLTKMEFRILAELESAQGAALGRGHLLQSVWGMPPETPTRTLDVHISRLKRKLGAASDVIRAVRGTGYSFVGFSRH